MAKQTTGFEVSIALEYSGKPAYRRLSAALRAEILEGRLAPGARLPATRDIAGRYGLSRGTIVSAFEELKAEGYVEGSVGSGTYVSRVLPDHLLQTRPAARRAPLVLPVENRRMSDYAKRVNPFTGFERRVTRAFRANLPALDLFPVTLWSRISAPTGAVTMSCQRATTR